MYDVQCTLYSVVVACEGVSFSCGCVYLAGWLRYVRRCVYVCIKVCLVAVGSVGDEAWASWIDDASTRSMLLSTVRHSLR